MGQIKKVKAYYHPNLGLFIIWHKKLPLFFFYLTHLRSRLGQKFLQKFRCFFGKFKTPQICSEINWPLTKYVELFLFSTGLFSFFYWNETDYGVRMPNEAIFHRNPKLLGLDRQFEHIYFAAFGVFSANWSALILVLWVHSPCFPLINIISTKN